jgi:hypothetical protein
VSRVPLKLCPETRRLATYPNGPQTQKCSFCKFEYARPYEYRVHLENKHLIANPDLILGKAPGSRPRAPLTEFDLIPLQPLVSPPAVEDQQNWAGSLLCPPAPPPAVEDQWNWAGSQLDPLAPPPAIEVLQIELARLGLRAPAP